ncbi:MAG TPA: hypothetical protein VGG49_03565 [Steroidobacteraceae bacterium]|jgi:hypothetical protein
MITRTSLPLASMLTAASSAIAVLSISACAAASPAFNPDGLQEAQLSRVAQVCQNVMGLSPSERLIGGEWLGDSRLDYWTSRYRGCVTSLSDSAQGASDIQANQQADRACRAKGYADGSPNLALCVLQSARQTQAPQSAQLTPAGQEQSAQALPTASGSLFYASPHETQQREELACAAMGIEPTVGAFTACVNDLQRTFHAIDTPIT